MTRGVRIGVYVLAPYGKAPTGGHRILRVQTEVEQYLLHLPGVGFHRPDLILDPLIDLNSFVDAALKKADGLLDDLIQINGLDLIPVAVGESQKRLCQISGSARSLVE